jgi:hypothetical protein
MYRLVSLASSSTPLDLYLLAAAFQPHIVHPERHNLRWTSYNALSDPDEK